MAYTIVYAPKAVEHLEGLAKQQQQTVLAKVDEQLTHQPTTATRNRKRMRPNPVAPWELRIGNLRVYYDVLDDSSTVSVLAIGVKIRNRVRIGREEIEL